MKMGRGVCAHLRVPSFYFVSDARCALLSTRSQKARECPTRNARSSYTSFSQMKNVAKAREFNNNKSKIMLKTDIHFNF